MEDFMAFTYNQVTLVGRLTKDPEYKDINNTFGCLKFTLAVNRHPRKDKVEPETDFIPVCLFGYSAQLGLKLLKKGAPCLVWGRMQVREYTKNDERRWMSEVVGDNFQILERLLGRASEEENGELASQEVARV
jgi:single-strand DNA-binding protein